TGNRINGNFVGTDGTGSLPVANRLNGIKLFDSASNIIGGSVPSARNVVSGNLAEGVRIEGPQSVGNQGVSCIVGLNAAGVKEIPNGSGKDFCCGGVYILEAPNNRIGGPGPTDGNIISGNLADGVTLRGVAASNNVVSGNLIGTDASGKLRLGNKL